MVAGPFLVLVPCPLMRRVGYLWVHIPSREYTLPPGYPNPWIAHNPEVTWDQRYPTHPRIHKSGRYTSYWNGFSLSMNSLLIFAAARCEELVAFPNKQSESNVIFAFAFPQCKLRLLRYELSVRISKVTGTRCDIM